MQPSSWHLALTLLVLGCVLVTADAHKHHGDGKAGKGRHWQKERSLPFGMLFPSPSSLIWPIIEPHSCRFSNEYYHASRKAIYKELIMTYLSSPILFPTPVVAASPI